MNLVFVRNPRSRRYILRLKPDGTVRATVPARGTIGEARAFAERNIEWINRQLQQRQRAVVWEHGTEILYRGQMVTLNVGAVVSFGDQVVPFASPASLRQTVERHLWQLAAGELSQRTRELAAQHNVLVNRITIRNQRTRWGSCSRRGTISLNWRLIQAPALVRDYIILHELMHRREMNHSKRFWREVASVCPDYRAAETWLKQNRHLNQNRG
jgi:predicted metal-dependent hydrolase